MIKKEVGLWIDHRKAVIVTIKNEDYVTREIRSNMGKSVRISSGSRSKPQISAQGSVAEDKDSRQSENRTGSFINGVISFIRDADSIWIFGPGEVKRELENCLRLEGLGEHIVGVATVGKMTDPQITAKVRGRYYKY